MDKIKLENVRFVYSQGTPFEHVALDGIDLTVKNGLITGIIGHTGSGKSTMMQLLNGLAAPTSGKRVLRISLRHGDSCPNITLFPKGEPKKRSARSLKPCGETYASALVL